jgi:hypothetical protein
VTDPTKGRIIDGAAKDTKLGIDALFVGDVNGDKYDDLVIGSVEWSSSRGKVWLVWGKPKAEATTPLFVNTLDASEFVEIVGESGSWFGDNTAGGDFNHDGFSDLLMGADHAATMGGRTYLLWGHNGTWPTTINAADIGESVGGVKFTGSALTFSGVCMANAGDVNGDGKTDLVICAHAANPSTGLQAGSAYIYYGKGNGTWPTSVSLSSIGSAGVTINGAAAGDHLCSSVGGNVDVNGDNIADIIVGAPSADPSSRSDAGISYVVFGSATLPTTINANDGTFFDGTKGFKLLGETKSDSSGTLVSGVGDVNGDGIGDVTVGAP